MRDSVSARLVPLTAAFLFGAGIPLIRVLTADFDVILLAGIRMLTAFACLASLWSRRSNKTGLTARDLALLTLCAALMIYLNQVLFVSGLVRTSATNGSLITAINPLAGALIAFVFLRERLSGRRALGVALGLGGVAAAILHRPGAELAHAGLGDLMIMAAVFLFVLGTLLVQRLAARLDVITISVAVHAIGSVLLLAHVALQAAWTGQAPRMPASAWPWLLAILSGSVFTGLANLLWNRSVAKIGLARAGVWIYWLPIFGIGTSVIFLGEPLSPWHFLGLLLVFSGTWLGTQRRRKWPADQIS